MGWFQKLFSGKPQRAKGRIVQATYDAATTTDENTKHWANTDSLSANASLSPGVRKTIRERARYEAQENNSIAKGIVLTLANDMVGTGPRLQVTTPDREVNNQIERRFSEWANAICLPEKLRTMKHAKTVDGEAFAHFRTNQLIDFPVQLDFRVDECDRYTSPFWFVEDPFLVDGVRFSEVGTPISYHRLRFHPGDTSFGAGQLEFDELQAADVIHLYRADRAEQQRGISELAAALPLFAMWRRYKLACLAAAETAADLAAVIQSTSPAIEEPEDLDTFDAIPIQQRVMLTMPRGWTLSQMKSEQPPNTLDMFERSIIQEMARSLNVPFNVAAGNSSGYNFASGKLDYQIYAKAIAVERHYWGRNCMDRIFAEWLNEARLIPGFMPDGIDLRSLPHQWFWDDVRPDIDPTKTANALATNLAVGATTLPREYARQGLDWEVEQERGAEALGISIDEYRASLRSGIFGEPMQPVAEVEDEEEV